MRLSSPWGLARFGAHLHPTARVYPRARCWAPWRLTMGEHACIGDDVDVYCVAPIRIGAHSTVSQYSYLCAATHDEELPDHPLIPRPITIGARCWIAADVFTTANATAWVVIRLPDRSPVLSSLQHVAPSVAPAP